MTLISLAERFVEEMHSTNLFLRRSYVAANIRTTKLFYCGAKVRSTSVGNTFFSTCNYKTLLSFLLLQIWMTEWPNINDIFSSILSTYSHTCTCSYQLALYVQFSSNGKLFYTDGNIWIAIQILNVQSVFALWFMNITIWSKI